MARRAPAKRVVRKRNPRVEVTLEKGGLTRELMLMAPREQYNVLSAVRGPDSHNDYNQFRLKKYLVERIRSIAFSPSIEFPGNYDNTPLDRDGLKAVKQHLTALQFGGKPVGAEHYLEHLRLAMMATWRHKVWGGHGYELMQAVSKAADF